MRAGASKNQFSVYLVREERREDKGQEVGEGRRREEKGGERGRERERERRVMLSVSWFVASPR